MDPSVFSSSLVGVVVPFLTQAVRRHILPWNDKAAHFLSLIIAATSVSVAYFFQGGTHNWAGWLANFTTAFTLSQVIYHQIGSEVFAGPDAPSNGSGGDGGAAVPPPAAAVPAVLPLPSPAPVPTVPVANPVTPVTAYPGAAISGTEAPKVLTPADLPQASVVSPLPFVPRQDSTAP